MMAEKAAKRRCLPWKTQAGWGEMEEGTEGAGHAARARQAIDFVRLLALGACLTACFSAVGTPFRKASI